ncbi:MAG TPA: HAD family hydrolase [Polyangiales bacterium]|nr:HAD family hydrolase [Polyangiales bacterium]
MSVRPNKAVFLDRDGVINKPMIRDGLPFAPKDMSEFEFLDGAREVCAALRDRGYVLLVCTNQPDVARGWQMREQVEEFHRYIQAQLPIAHIYACYHDDKDGCDCRKPKPGMLLSGSRDFDVELSRSWMVGDRWKDIVAGRDAGCRTAYLRHGYDETPARDPDYEIRSLVELLDIIV